MQQEPHNAYMHEELELFRHVKKGVSGAAGGDRTHDPWLRRPILYPLSYSRTERGLILSARRDAAAFRRWTGYNLGLHWANANRLICTPRAPYLI